MRCLCSANRHFSLKASSTSQRRRGRHPRSLPLDSDMVLECVRGGLKCSSIDDVLLGLMLRSGVTEDGVRLARIVPPFLSQPSSSSARFANTSGSSSSGGRVDIQHIRIGSNIMFPTLRASPLKEPTGEVTEDPVRCVMRAGRDEVPTATSNSRRICSLPSHRSVLAFHFISPTTKGKGE
jgi:hypothetical protein